MSMSLYEITTEYQQALQNLHDEETGELNEESVLKLNQISGAIESKAIAVASFISNLEAEQKAIEDAVGAMMKRQMRIESKVCNLKNYLKINMEKSGINQIKCAYFDIKLKKNPYSTEFVDVNLIPEKYIKREMKEVVKIDKTAIKKDVLETGEQVPGAFVSQQSKIEIN